MALLINLNSKIINPPTKPQPSWAEYESICAAEREAEAVYWQQKRLAAQIVAMMGMEHYMAAVELAELQDGTLQRMIDDGAELQELQDGMADDEFNRWGGA